jgi:hypothetical protein
VSKVVLQQLHHRAALVSFDLDIGILDDGPWRRRPLRPAGEPDRAPSPVLRGGKGLLLFVSLQFPLSPMMGFSRRVEHALDVTVQRLHEANPRSIVGPPFVATRIKACIAACHSGASCSAFGSLVI